MAMLDGRPVDWAEMAAGEPVALRVPARAAAVRVPGSVFGVPAIDTGDDTLRYVPVNPRATEGGSVLSNTIVTDAILALVVVSATAASIWTAGFTHTELMAVYVYAIGYVTGRPVGTPPKPPV